MKIYIRLTDELPFGASITREYKVEENEQPDWNEVIEDIFDSYNKAEKL